MYEGKLITQWIACKCGFSTRVWFNWCQVSNTCTSPHRQRIRRLPAVVVSPEERLSHWRDKLCVQGRLLGGKGETGMEHVSWHLLTPELSPDHSSPHRTGNCSASGPSAMRHSWLMSTMWTFSEHENVYVSHTLRLPPNVHSQSVFTMGIKKWESLTLYWNSSEIMCGCEVVLVSSNTATIKAPAHSWNQVLHKTYSQCTFLCSPHLRVFTDWTETHIKAAHNYRLTTDRQKIIHEQIETQQCWILTHPQK